MLANLLAISWEPELRGILIVIIATVVLCGSIYMILATNIGARLGFLVALTGLFGWMMLMGIVWAIYGIGLKGPEPSWQAVPGRTVLQDTGALYQAGVFDARLDVPEGSTPADTADARQPGLRRRGLGAAGRGGSGVRPGLGRRRHVPRGDRRVRRRRVHAGQRVHDRR